MKPKGKSKLSVMQIAAVAGVSETLVRKKLNQGKTARAIIADAELRDQDLSLRVQPYAPPSEGANGHAAADGMMSFARAQTAKENHLAELRRIEVMRLRNELIPTSYVKIWGQRFLVEARDAMLRGPSELQDVLAAESNPPKVNAILTAWVEKVLRKYYELGKLWSEPPEDIEGYDRRYQAAKLALVKR